MELQSTDLITFVLSAGGMIAITESIRKYVPWIDKWRVPLLVVILSWLAGVSERLLRDPKHWYLGLATGTLLAMTAIGTDEKIKKTVDRHRGKTKGEGKSKNEDTGS